MHFLVLINTCSHTYTCLPESSHADATQARNKYEGSVCPCLCRRIQLYEPLAVRGEVWCVAHTGQEFLDRSNRGSPQPCVLHKTPRMVNDPLF